MSFFKKSLKFFDFVLRDYKMNDAFMSNQEKKEGKLRVDGPPIHAVFDYKIETPKVYNNSMLDVGCSMLDVHFLFYFTVQCLIEYVALRFTPVQEP